MLTIKTRSTLSWEALPADHPDRYKRANPGDLLPFNLPQLLLQGDQDDPIPPALPARWAQRSRSLGDAPRVTLIPSAGHFDGVDPESNAWPTVMNAVKELLTPTQHQA